MDNCTAYILANSPFITEDRIRHARRHQVVELQRSAGEAGSKLSENVRRCTHFNG